MMEWIRDWLLQFNMDPDTVTTLTYIVMSVLIILLCVVANLVTKKIVLKILAHVIKRNRFTWDDKLLERKVFQRLSHLVPAMIIFHFAPLYQGYQPLIEKAAFIYMIIVIMLVVNSS